MCRYRSYFQYDASLKRCCRRLKRCLKHLLSPWFYIVSKNSDGGFRNGHFPNISKHIFSAVPCTNRRYCAYRHLGASGIEVSAIWGDKITISIVYFRSALYGVFRFFRMRANACCATFKASWTDRKKSAYVSRIPDSESELMEDWKNVFLLLRKSTFPIWFRQSRIGVIRRLR